MSAVLVRDDVAEVGPAESGPGEGRRAVRVVTLNRPERLNAISMAVLEGLDAALAGALAAPAVGAVLLQGAGRAFCAGDDLQEQHETSAGGPTALARQVEILQRISEHMLFGAKPVVGAVQGWAVGGAFAWTLNCDFALWAGTARGFLPEIPLGLFVSGGATWLLPRYAGPNIARDLIYRARRMTGRELAEAGIAYRAVPEADLPTEALALARELAALPPAAAAREKRALTEPDRAALRAAMVLEAEACIAGAGDLETLARLKSVLKRK